MVRVLFKSADLPVLEFEGEDLFVVWDYPYGPLTVNEGDEDDYVTIACFASDSVLGYTYADDQNNNKG